MKKSKALSRLYKLSHFKMTGRSCTDKVQEKQGRRRIFKSGPAEEASREGIIPPLVGGVWWVSPEKICEFSALLCAFLWGFYANGTRFQSFARQNIFCRMRNRMLDKIVFIQSCFLKLFYSSMFL